MSLQFYEPSWLSYQNINNSDIYPDNMNYTQPIWDKLSNLEIALKSLLVIIVCIIGLIGNFLVIFFVLRQPKIRKQPVNIYIVNLAIADFMTIIFTPGIALVNNAYQNYQLGPVMCKLEILIKMMCILVSIFSVVAISFQRFLNINSPMSGQINKSSNPRTLLIIIFIWIASILLALPLAIWRVYRERLWMDWDERWCTDDPADLSIKYWIFLISPLIYIPLIAMIVIYWLMIVKINRFIKKLQKSVGLNSKEASYNSNSNDSSLQDVYELRLMQEANRKKVQEARKKQHRSITEPTDSISRQSQLSSYFSDGDSDLHSLGDRRSRSSSISVTFASSSPVSRAVRDGGSTYHSKNHSKHCSKHHSKRSYQPAKQQSKNLQLAISPLTLQVPVPLPLITKKNVNKARNGSNSVSISISSEKENKRHNGDDNVNHQDAVKNFQQLATSRQVISANLYKRSVMFTIIVFCLITFIFWLPLQVLVYYRAFKPKIDPMACWFENIKFVAQILCAVNSAINPFVTFRRTFLQIYHQYCAKQKQLQLRKRLKKNHLKMNVLNQSKNKKPNPSLETVNLTPVIHVIEVYQHQSGKAGKSQKQIESFTEKSSPRKRKISHLLEVEMINSLENSAMAVVSLNCSSNGHLPNQPASPISNSSSTTSDPLAAYMAEQHSETETPSPEVIPLPITIFTSKLTTDSKVTDISDTDDKQKVSALKEPNNMKSTTSTYTHNLTKKMLMKYTPERFDNK